MFSECRDYDVEGEEGGEGGEGGGIEYPTLRTESNVPPRLQLAKLLSGTRVLPQDGRNQ